MLPFFLCAQFSRYFLCLFRLAGPRLGTEVGRIQDDSNETRMSFMNLIESQSFRSHDFTLQSFLFAEVVSSILIDF